MGVRREERGEDWRIERETKSGAAGFLKYFDIQSTKRNEN